MLLSFVPFSAQAFGCAKGSANTLVHDTIAGEPAKTNVKKDTWLDNVVFGGNVGLQIGTITMIDISPGAGYFFTPKTMAGIGLMYQYYASNYGQKFVSHIYGSRFFGEYIFFDNPQKKKSKTPGFSLFAHAEYEALNLDRDFSLTNGSKMSRFWLHGVLVGGGIMQRAGKHASFNIAILYNLLQDNRTPYDNPRIRIGFYF